MEFRQVLHCRVRMVLVTRGMMSLFALALILQNVYVQSDAQIHLAALYPYGWAGTALVTLLYLLDPVTLFYAYAMGRVLRFALPGWPGDTAYACSGITDGDLRSPLWGWITVAVLFEIVLSFVVQALFSQPEIRDFLGLFYWRGALALVSVPAAAMSILCGGFWGRGLALRFALTCLLQLPLLLIFYWAEVSTYQALVAGRVNPATQYYGFAMVGVGALALLYVTFFGVVVSWRQREHRR